MNLNNKLVYTTKSELSTIELAGMAEHVSDIGQEDLFQHHRNLVYVFSESIKNKPELREEVFKTFAFISESLLTAARYEPIAREIYNDLAEPIRNL